MPPFVPYPEYITITAGPPPRADQVWPTFGEQTAPTSYAGGNKQDSFRNHNQAVRVYTGGISGNNVVPTGNLFH
jgi:hypothetical protein